MLQTHLSIPFLIKKSDKKNAKLMLLVHGYGSNEADLFSFSAELPNEFTIVSIRGILPTIMGGFSWYDINFTDFKKFNNIEQAHQSAEKIYQFTKECIQEYELDTSEVWLCGFSQGAILSYYLALNHPEIFKKVLCLSGYPAKDILGEIPEKDYHELDFFISHGKEDVVIPVEWARLGPSLLNENKIKHEFHEYNSGHGVAPQNFYDLMEWIQKRL